MSERTVIVEPPSVLRETGMVVRVAFHVVLWTAIAMGATWFPHAGVAPAVAAPATAIGEVAFRELPGELQRMYTRCLEGLAEAEDTRSTTGAWPGVDDLAARGVPPFARDPIDHAGYHWKLLRDAGLVDYVGTPAHGPTLLITALEPDPGTPVDPRAVTDETHHRLRDGTMIHVAVWVGPQPITAPVITPPIEAGWRRIVRGTP